MSGYRVFEAFSPILKGFRFILLLMPLACEDGSPQQSLHSLLDGTWWSSCMSRQDWFASYRLELDFEQARLMSLREHYFADSDCIDSRADLVYSGDYALQVTSRDYVYGIDLIFTEQKVEPLNAAGSELLQELNFCGHSVWSPLEAQAPVIFDRALCSASGPMPLKNFNLVRITRGSSLEFGADLMIESERPTEVRSSEPTWLFLSQAKL